MGIRKWERYLWTLWDVYIPGRTGSSSVPQLSPAFLLLHCLVVSCWLFLKSLAHLATLAACVRTLHTWIQESWKPSYYSSTFSAFVYLPPLNKTAKLPHLRKTWTKRALRTQKLTGKWKVKISSFKVLIANSRPMNSRRCNAAFINIHLVIYSRKSLLKAAVS